MKNPILELMVRGERRDFTSQPMDEEEALILGYDPATRTGNWSVVASVKEQIEMELAVFGETDPMELFYEKEHYIDHPEDLIDA